MGLTIMIVMLHHWHTIFFGNWTRSSQFSFFADIFFYLHIAAQRYRYAHNSQNFFSLSNVIAFIISAQSNFCFLQTFVLLSSMQNSCINILDINAKRLFLCSIFWLILLYILYFHFHQYSSYQPKEISILSRLLTYYFLHNIFISLKQNHSLSSSGGHLTAPSWFHVFFVVVITIFHLYQVYINPSNQLRVLKFKFMKQFFNSLGYLVT